MKTSARVAQLVTGASNRRFLKRQSKTKGSLQYHYDYDDNYDYDHLPKYEKVESKVPVQAC